MPVTAKSLQLRERTAPRNERIRKDHEKLWKNGKRADIIFSELAVKYFLSKATIEAIVFKKGVYAEF
jgi:hypothetical protein